MSVTAAQVKELREMTQAPMMECKKALTATNGDLKAAMLELAKSGQAKAQKKAGRITAEGMVAVSISDDQGAAAMVEVNAETDFVARESKFQEFVQLVASTALKLKSDDIAKISASPIAPDAKQSIEDLRMNLVHTLGENIQIRRVALHQLANGRVAAYVHGGQVCGRIGAIVALGQTEDYDLTRNLAMHLAAMNPEYLNLSDVPAERKDLELESAKAQAEQAGEDQTPEQIEKAAKGIYDKSVTNLAFLSQGYVRSPRSSVEKVLSYHKANIESFIRFEVGEGIEKKEENFVAEVMSQIK